MAKNGRLMELGYSAKPGIIIYYCCLINIAISGDDGMET